MPELILLRLEIVLVHDAPGSLVPSIVLLFHRFSKLLSFSILRLFEYMCIISGYLRVLSTRHLLLLDPAAPVEAVKVAQRRGSTADAVPRLLWHDSIDRER